MNRSIAIIGAGASGLSLANQIILMMTKDHLQRDLTLAIYEKRSEAGPGNAYAMDLKSNLMNTQVGALDQGYGEGYGLLAFLKANPDLTAKYDVSSKNLKEEFIPRSLFGLYLKSFAEHIQRQAVRNGVEIKIVQDEVQDISFSHVANKFVIETYSESAGMCDYAYLCVGHLDPKIPVEYATNRKFLNTCYPLENLVANLPKTASIGILGTRLSAIDTLIALKESGHQGPIHCVSRSGRLPAISSTTKAHRPQILTRQRIEGLATGRLSLMLLAKMLKAEIKLAAGYEISLKEILQPELNPLAYYEHEVRAVEKKRHRPYQAALHSVDDIISLIWKLTSAHEKQIFLKKYLSLWMSLWVSIPLVNGRKILSYLKSHEVRIHGQLKEHRFNIETSKFELVDRSQSILAEVDYLINATGSPSDVMQADDILMSNLLRRKLVGKDPLGGIHLDGDSGAVIDPATGKMNPRLSVIGPLSSGAYFFVTVLEVIERQSKAQAYQLRAMTETKNSNATHERPEYLKRMNLMVALKFHERTL